MGKLEALRRPAYTGENRCTPCTVLNVFLAATAGGALAVFRPAVGAVAFALSLLAIYLRGYLVPGTPTITARYFPDWILELFGKESVSVERDDRPDDNFVDICGVVERSPTTGRRLTPSFRRAWNDRVHDASRSDFDRGDVADLFGVAPDAVTAMGERRYLVDNERLVQWPTEAALVADVTAGRELRRCSEWDERTIEERIESLTTLRTLRRECPACGESLSRVEETVESCCQPPANVVSVFCEECDAQIAEMRID